MKMQAYVTDELFDWRIVARGATPADTLYGIRLSGVAFNQNGAACYCGAARVAP